MTNQEIPEDLVNACAVLEIDPSVLSTLKMKDVVSKYRKKAVLVQPDKADEEPKDQKTKEFQDLNKSYHLILKYVVEILHTNATEEDDDEKFIKDNLSNSTSHMRMMVA